MIQYDHGEYLQMLHEANPVPLIGEGSTMSTSRKEDGRPYGKSIELFRDAKVRLCIVEACAGGFSSRHLHHDCANLFSVVEGKLEIRLFDDPHDVSTYERVLLTPEGTSRITVPSGKVHGFVAHTYVACHEVYFADPGKFIDPRDITRFSENGVLPPEEIAKL